MYFKHSLLTSALSQKSLYSALFLTPEDVLFVILADDSALNVVERFAVCVFNCDDNFRDDGSSDDGVDTRARDAASGVLFVILTDDSALNADERFAVRYVFNCDDNFRSDGSSDDGVDTRARDADSGVTTSGTSGNTAAAEPCA